MIKFTSIKLDSEYQGVVRKEDNWQTNHWKCVLKYGKKQYTFDYYMGMGLSGEPEVDDVLESLLLDSYAIHQDFEDWCSEFGYDNDSRKAEAMYKACIKSAKSLERVFGDLQDVETLVNARQN